MNTHRQVASNQLASTIMAKTTTAKAKIGRPKSVDPKEAVLYIRCTEEDKKMFQAAAEEDGKRLDIALNEQAWALRVLRRAARKTTEAE